MNSGEKTNDPNDGLEPDSKIKIEDLSPEAGGNTDADDVRGGQYVLQNVMVSSNTPRRP